MLVEKQESYLHSHWENKRTGENWHRSMQKVKVSDKSWKVAKDGTMADTVTENQNVFKILRKNKKTRMLKKTSLEIWTVVKHFEGICELKQTSLCVKTHCSFRNDSVLTQLFLLVPVIGLFVSLDEWKWVTK